MSELTERIRNGIMEGWSANYPCLDGEIAVEAADALEAQEASLKEAMNLLQDVVDGAIWADEKEDAGILEMQIVRDIAGFLHLSKALTPSLPK